MAALSILLLLAACSSGDGDGNQGAGADGKLSVVTTIAQIAEPIARIGGDRVHVSSLMGPGVDPHLYNASQGDIIKLENADVVFYSGLHLEGNMGEVFIQVGKTKPVVAIAEAIAEEQLLHDETGQVDPHVWFDIDLWKQALAAAVQTLQEQAPADAEFFEANKQQYFAELDALKQEAREKLLQIPEQKRVLVTAHDAFGYFGRMQQIRVVGLQGLSTEDEIGLSDINAIIKILTEFQVPAVFVESSINPDHIKSVIDGAKSSGLDVKLGGELYSDAMGAAGTDEGTYIGMYRHNVNTIYAALSGMEQ